MLRFFLVTALCFITAIALAQSSFVEVTVEDTLQLEPEEIIYVVGYDGYFSVDSVAVSTMDTVSYLEMDYFKEVRKLIGDMRLDTVAIPDTYTISASAYYNRGNFIRIRFTSLAKLQEFVGRLRRLEGMSGSIANLSSSKEAQGERLLSQRLFEKAKAKAAELAQITGKKLGSLLSAKEEKLQGGWTMYPPVSSVPGWHATIGSQRAEYIVLSKAMVFQFHWQ